MAAQDAPAIGAVTRGDSMTIIADDRSNQIMASGTLEQLRKLGGDSFAAEMIGVFLEYVAKKIAQGQQAYAAGDLAGVENALHPIKSSAGNVGARQIQELAARIEDLAKKRQGESLGVLLAGANVHDTKLLEATIEAIVVDRPEPTKKADKPLS